MRKITISKTGTLNIYIAIEISEDIPLEDIENAKDAVKKLITKVKNLKNLKNKAKTKLRSCPCSLKTYKHMAKIYAAPLQSVLSVQHFWSPQISSFAMNPNYEIVFFTCDIHEVANIIDYRSGNSAIQTIMQQLENFQING